MSKHLWNEALERVRFTNTSALVAAGLERRQILVEILYLVQKQEFKEENGSGKGKMFKSVGDIFVQYDPVHASLPWAVVRFLLQAVVSDTNSNAAILEGVEIGRNMDGLTQSMDVCQTSKQSLENGISSTKLLGNDLGQRLGELHKLTQTIQQDMSSAELRLNKIEHHLVKALNDLKDPVQRIAEDLSSVQDNLKEQKQVKVFKWLTMIPGSSHHRDKLRTYYLWESMLVCHVIEYLRNRAQQHPSSAPIAYFYCARTINEPERTDPTQILRNVLEQLCSFDAETPTREPVSKKHLARRKEARGRTPEKLSLEETVNIILELLESNPATIVLDGLDECGPVKRNNLLLGMQTIITNSNNIIKVLLVAEMTMTSFTI
ncbi:uncharacterized protein EAF01_004438 [Botrytis porri]|uniref:uncharacterized protein n=1 Tax=Botrytis porri TaxID=87229 RepID=UPI001901BC4A|nr:uncharacterized protein EAF01_004438 [Botrytis porri]KAF7908683.1 hypothetical protein EAF01_004438 [Botrytis porri]